MTFDLSGLTPHLERGADGIWYAPRQAPVSYPEHGNADCVKVEGNSFWFAHRNRCITAVIRRFAPARTLLDVGGGNGYVSKGLSAAGVTCALVEPGIDGARAARDRGVDPVICARLEDLSAAHGSVDAIGMFDVLEHIEDQAAALQQVHALLRPGGRLFLTVPAYNFLHSADDVAAGHFRRYTARRLRRVVSANGFRPEYTTYLFAPLPPAVFALRTLPTLLGRRRPDDTEQSASDHVRRSTRFLLRLLDAEGRRIERGSRLPFGTSCLAVCVKE